MLFWKETCKTVLYCIHDHKQSTYPQEQPSCTIYLFPGYTFHPISMTGARSPVFNVKEEKEIIILQSLYLFSFYVSMDLN